MGCFVTIVGIPSFLVTLGTMEIGAGLAGGARLEPCEPIPVASSTFERVFGGGSIGGIGTVYLWTLGVVCSAGHVIYRKTPFGRFVLATGGNRLAAGYSGIRTKRIKIQVFALSGLAASLAGLIYTGRLGSGSSDLGSSDLLTVIAAVVIGGTSLFGGKGSVIGAFVGSLLIGVLIDGLILMNISVSDQMVTRAR